MSFQEDTSEHDTPGGFARRAHMLRVDPSGRCCCGFMLTRMRATLMSDFATLAQITGESASWPDSYGERAQPRMGFFTDTSVCIGCKACEVACKEWNLIPEDGLNFLANSYDNSGGLGADTWRHVAFVEQRTEDGVRWLMNSDVCKHCTRAACLEVCPTGALFRTEYGTVVIQDDVCNG